MEIAGAPFGEVRKKRTKNCAWKRLPISRPCISGKAAITVSMLPFFTAARSDFIDRISGMDSLLLYKFVSVSMRPKTLAAQFGLPSFNVRAPGFLHISIILFEDLYKLRICPEITCNFIAEYPCCGNAAF